MSILFVAIWSNSALACPDIDGLLDRNCDQKLEIVTFGDSITFGIKDEEGLGYPGRLRVILPSAIIRNLGVPGENTYSGRSRASKTLPDYPDADFVIALEGVNDYWLSSPSASSTRNNVLSIVRSAENLGAITLLGNLTAIKRPYQKWWVSSVNSALQPYRDIDFFSLGEGIISSDLLHPDGAGYQLMAELVMTMLLQASSINRPVDTDGDGMYDFAEPNYGADPANPDTDGDGILDGAEVFTYGSSPALVDTDSDGYSDYDEVQIGANPSNPLPGAPTLNDLEIVLQGS